MTKRTARLIGGTIFIITVVVLSELLILTKEEFVHMLLAFLVGFIVLMLPVVVARAKTVGLNFHGWIKRLFAFLKNGDTSSKI